MKLQVLCAALLAASSVFAQTSNPPPSPSAPSTSGTAIREVPPSTGSSADAAGSGTTAPRSPTSDTSSVGTTAIEGSASAGATRSTGRCDTLLGEERQKCLKEQAATGTAK